MLSWSNRAKEQHDVCERDGFPHILRQQLHARSRWLHRALSNALAKLQELSDRIHGSRPQPVAGTRDNAQPEGSLIAGMVRRNNAFSSQLDEMDRLLTVLDAGL